MQTSIAHRAVVLAAAFAAGSAVPCLAQGAPTRIQPGFNLFTVQQDVEIGHTSELQADSQLNLLHDPAVDAWLNRIIQRLAAVAPGAKYPYHIKAVNAADINAFALPGGPMYVNRGAIAAAGSEAELAGVLAHEMSHVALRHGTHQASTAYLAQTGLGILGGLLGKNGSAAGIVNAVGGLGLNAAFLKFSRTYEYQADETGATIMARAGYNPTAMADFFEKLRVIQGHDPSKVEAFFSDRPRPTARPASGSLPAVSPGPPAARSAAWRRSRARCPGCRPRRPRWPRPTPPPRNPARPRRARLTVR
jgi:predicted Zn-dependent protease